MDFITYRSLEKKAWALVAEKAGSEMRYASAIPNQPYWTHLIEVHLAEIESGVTDPEELLAAILHDIVEDSELVTSSAKLVLNSGVCAIFYSKMNLALCEL